MTATVWWASTPGRALGACAVIALAFGSSACVASPDNDQAECADAPRLQYVAIDDLSETTGYAEHGTLVDAVSVTTRDGVEWFADASYEWRTPDQPSQELGPHGILGPPDGSCDMGYMALAGNGFSGGFVAAFDPALEPQQWVRVTVYTVRCSDEQARYEVAALGSDRDHAWLKLGEGDGISTSFTAPGCPSRNDAPDVDLIVAAH